MYDAGQKQEILQIAREALHAALSGRRAVALEHIPDYLNEPRGCFVTLENPSHELRGCIGTFEADRPLIRNLVEMAGAATRDPRFIDQPITKAEVDSLRVEVSILTPLEPMDDPLDLQIGVDGIYIIDESAIGRRSGCFLPQVATDQGWNAEQMVTYCCWHKMGLGPDAWHPPTSLKFFRFQAEIISEESPGGGASDS